MCKKRNVWDSDPIEPCPYCGSDCHADHVDVGVGYVQCGPYHCDECGASENGPEGTPDNATDKMKKTGWYEPESDQISPYANAVMGILVDHKTAKKAYRMGILDEKPNKEFPELI